MTLLKAAALPAIFAGIVGLNFIALPGASGATAATKTPARAKALPKALRPALRRAPGKDEVAYRIGGDGCTRLPNPSLKACFNADGVQFKSSANAALALRLKAFGRGNKLTPVTPGKPRINGNRVSYHHGALTEWWRMLPLGFEQGFTVTQRPSGNGRLKLVLASNRVPSLDGQVLSWGKFRYGKLIVTDASGSVLPAHLAAIGKRILISLNDTDATYPITVDPLVWLEQEVTASDGAANSYFGSADALNGSTAVIGADGDNSFRGAAYVFTRSNGSWNETQKLTASDGLAGDEFGYRVALDNHTLIVGAFSATFGGVFSQGAAYVFTKSGDSWSQSQKLTASDGGIFDNFGASVALDDNLLVIGANGATVGGNGAQGAVYVFTKSNGTWTQIQKITASDGSAYDNFGLSVALEGTTVLVGSPRATVNGNAAQGAVYVFTKSGSTWSQAQKLTANDGTWSAQFGESLALDGNTAFVGANTATVKGNAAQGAAYVFTKSGEAWTQTQKLSANDGSAYGYFGNAIALDGDTALIGADGSTIDSNAYQGKAYVFTRSGGNWSQSGILTASDGTTDSYFGAALALEGTTALISTVHTVINGNNWQGSAYFYGRSNLDLAVSAPAFTNPGDNFTSEAITTNSASVTSPAVVLTMAVPAAASFVSATANQGSCTEDSGVVSCAFGPIAGNAGRATVDLTLRTGNEGGATFENTGTLVHTTPLLRADATTTVNNPPIADDGTLVTRRNKAADGILRASDADNDPLVFSVVSPPAHGSVTINDTGKGFYTYTPATGYASGDSFTFKVNDGHADSNVATIIVTITNQPPVASDGTLTTDKNVAAKGTLKASDPDGDPLAYSIVAPPAHGAITLDAATGAYSYTPASDYFGSDGFTFKVNDGQTDSNIAAVVITVKGSAPPPPTPPSNNDGGGGSFGGLMLILLSILGIAIFPLRRRNRTRFLRQSTPVNRQKAQTGPEHKETRMNYKRMTTTIGALMLATTTWLAPTTGMARQSTATAQKTAMIQSKHTDLTRHDIENAQKAGLPSRLVTMAPQSSLKLLALAQKTGVHAVNSTIKITVGLKLRNEAKLKTFLQQVQNPASPVYRQFLTPEQFTAMYGPTKAEVATVTAFLKARGIKVKDVSPNRTLIHTEATTAIYDHAFGVRINDYKLDGRRFYSTTDSPKLPRAIAPLIVNIIGLNHGVQMHPLSYFKALGADGQMTTHAPPPATTGYFNPYQIAKAYGWPDITDPDNGAGVSIAILTALTPGVSTNPNYHTFWTDYGLPDHTINVIPIDGESGSGGEGETALDIEWSGAMAPGATLNVYVAANAGDAFTDMYNRFVTDNTSQVMTTSWGLGESGNPDINVSNEQIFMQAAAQGISMFAAAGDNGASDCIPAPGYCPPGPNNADYPSSSVYITAANGTELTISDVNGTYGNEHAWADTGGAISELFDKPAWQHGPGVPTDVNMRMNSDMALNAGSLHPFLTYLTGSSGTGYYGVWGTSAVAPTLAGLFAIGVSQQPDGASLGQSNSLIYNDVNADNYTSDFHDVTEGCNGYLPDGSTASCAKANWDHPTGWGSPKATSLLSHLGVHGPSGTLTGTVTAATSGAPIAGAVVTVTAGDFSKSKTTENDGTYSMLLPVGSYTVTVSDFGYASDTASISITDGVTITRNFALAAASTATLHGKVSDGSGHGYGLYAEIKVRTSHFGQVADVWTNPETGEYSIKLPVDSDYTLNVAAAFNGYNTGTATVTLSANKTKDFALTVIAACTAPGYTFNGANDFSQDFNGAAFPPTGWTVANGIPGKLVVWKLNSTWGADNYTGGTGTSADADEFSAGVSGPYDTSLITPPIPVANVRSSGTILEYKANYNRLQSGAFDLDISSDDGATWTNISHWTTNHGTQLGLPGVKVRVDLAPYLPASGNFQLRWRFYDLTAGWSYYAQVDDVVIGICQPLPGALVFGQVTDANTGDGIVGAAVTDEAGNGATTIVNAADPNLPIGTYGFFESAGDHTLTARDPYYTPDSTQLTVNNNKIETRNFTLKAGQLVTTPNAFTLHVMVNNLATAAFALKNTGTGDANFKVWAINAPPPVSANATGPFAAAPNYSVNKNLAALTAAGKITHRSWSVSPIRHATPHTAGDPVSNFPAGIAIYGLGVDHNLSDLWLGSPSYGGLGGDDQNHRFLFDGTNTGDAINVANPDVLYMADMAFDDRTDMIWQLSVDGANGSTSHIFELDPATMQPTGKSILVPSPQSERGLAYDPLSNTWYAGDFNSGILYHFNASGTLLDSANVSLPITGLAYNPTTEHLFVLTSSGDHAVYVLDARNNYAQIGYFDIAGFDPTNSGAGMGYDCNGNLWISDYVNQVVWRVDSGEMGWCAEKGIPWLTLAPATGTVTAGASTNVKLTFDGTGQKEFTTSLAQLKVTGNTPYPAPTVPLTVTWDPQPVNLALTGSVSPSAAQKGNVLVYTITATNRQADNHGAASQVKFSYPLPQGAKYEAASGDAVCTAPTAGSAPAPASGTVTCDFGTIALGNSKTETLAIRAVDAGKLTSHFEVSAREPDNNGDDNHLSLTSVVLGNADLALAADSASIPAGGTGSLTLTLKNAGPDPASAVQIHAKAGSGTISLRSATASQGSCALSGGALACQIGQMDAGKTVTVTLQLFGAYTGSTTVNAQASTASDEPDTANNGVSAKVTVKAPPPPDNGGGSGGGAFGWLALALLGCLASGGIYARKRLPRL